MKSRFFLFAVFLSILFTSHVIAEDAWTYITEIDGQEIGYILSMASEEDGTIWVCSSGGVFRYIDRIWKNESTHFEYPIYSLARHVAISPNGNVWFCCSPNILVKYDGENWHYYSNPKLSTVFDKLDVDAQDIVWCCSNKGIFQFDGTDWKQYTVENGLASNNVSLVTVSPLGVVWVRYGDLYSLGKLSGIKPSFYGISRFDGSKWITFNTENGIKSNRVDDIEIGPDGTVYISYGLLDGDIEQGIARFDGITWKTISDTINGELEFDRSGTLWIVQLFTEVIKYNGLSFKLCTPKPSEIPRYTHKMGFDQDGNVWFSVFDGIIKYDIDTAVQSEDLLKPKDLIYLCNYPNPFNSSSTIEFNLQKFSNTTLSVYNIKGQKVAILVEKMLSPGLHSIVFDATGLPSGLYFIRLQSGKIVKSERMLLIK